MNNKVQDFLNDKFGEVRALKDAKGNIWFVASDVARVLGYNLQTDMTRNLDDDEKGMQSLHTLGGVQEFTVINESGLYSIVMSITKRNAERYEKAREFKKWICGTVIPALRKDGMYIDGEEKVATNELSEDEFILRAVTMLQNKVDRLQKERDEFKKSNDQFLNANSVVDWNTLAKNLNIGRNTMLKHLREIGVLMDNNIPYQQYMGYFEVKFKNVQRGNFSDNVPVVLTKPRGQEFLWKQLKKRGIID